MSDLQQMLFQIADLERRLAYTGRQGTVHEVKGDKIRVAMGTKADGKPWLSPWLHTGNHRGGARERRFYKKGQNVMLSAPNGDLRQAEVQAYAENEQFKAPDHANKSGQDEETYQLDDNRARDTKGTHERWIEPAQQQQGQGGQQGGQGGGGQQQGGQQGGDVQMKQRMDKDGGLTGRVKEAGRYAAHKDGAKIKFNKDVWVVVTSTGIIMSHEPTIGPDPIPDDDK